MDDERTEARVTFLAHLGAAGVYALAAWLARGPARARRLLPWVLALGALVHVVGFLGFHGETPPVPIDSTAAALSLIGWLVATAYLLSLGYIRTTPVGVWVALGAALCTLGAALGLRLPGLDAGSPGPAGAWPHAHVLLSTGGFALLALSGIAGAGYLLKERSLKRKRPPAIELPSLESLDRLEHAALALGFPLLTLGVLTGYVWAMAVGEGGAWSPHALFLQAAWLVFLVPVSLRLLRRERGPRASRTVVVGFAVLLFCYLGIRLVWGTA